MIRVTETATAPPAAVPFEWSALLIPFDIPSVDGREIRHPQPWKELTDLHRPLPLPLRWSPLGTDLDAPNSAQGAVVGRVDRLELRPTAASGELWGHGVLDLTVPGFAELVAAAWRVRNYMPGLSIGVDVDELVATEVEDGPHRTLVRFDAFRLIGVTINTGAAWPNVRLELIPPADYTPTATPPAAPHPEA